MPRQRAEAGNTGRNRPTPKAKPQLEVRARSAQTIFRYITELEISTGAHYRRTTGHACLFRQPRALSCTFTTSRHFIGVAPAAPATPMLAEAARSMFENVGHGWRSS